MDYETFFYALRECHRSHGLPFDHRFSDAFDKETKGNKFSNTILKSFCYSKKTRSGGCVMEIKAPTNGATKNGTYSKSFDFKMPWSMWRNPADMVYTIAWRLSERIGRLPDHLHNRMVLSADRHIAISRYIRKHG